MIWCKNAEISTGKSIYYDFLCVEFKVPVLKICGKTVEHIQHTEIPFTDDAIDYIKENIDKQVNLSFAELGTLLDNINSVDKNSHSLEVVFKDGTRVGGFLGERIDWSDERKEITCLTADL